MLCSIATCKEGQRSYKNSLITIKTQKHGNKEIQINCCHDRILMQLNLFDNILFNQIMGSTYSKPWSRNQTLLSPIYVPLRKLKFASSYLLLLRNTENTWYHIQLAPTGINTMKTCQAIWDMTAMIPKSCINAKANSPSWEGINVSTALWSVDACQETESLLLTH